MKAMQRSNPSEFVATRPVLARSGPRWGIRLPTYRLYRLDGAGRISGAEWIEAADDEEARSKSRGQSGSGRYELWERYRLVERVTGEQG